MPTLAYHLTAQENQTRKNWLNSYIGISLVFLCYSLYSIFFVPYPNFQTNTFWDKMEHTQQALTLLTLYVLFKALSFYINYRFSYQKYGTKLLLLRLFLIIPIVALSSIVEIYFMFHRMHPSPEMLLDLIYNLATLALSLANGVFSKRLYKLNKRVKNHQAEALKATSEVDAF